MRPDAKVQVTVEYEKVENIITPLRIDTILISCQHNDNVSNEVIRSDLEKLVIRDAIPEKWLQ
jgi:S-adenosylmethionine synthetase